MLPLLKKLIVKRTNINSEGVFWRENASCDLINYIFILIFFTKSLSIYQHFFFIIIQPQLFLITNFCSSHKITLLTDQ